MSKFRKFCIRNSLSIFGMYFLDFMACRFRRPAHDESFVRLTAQHSYLRERKRKQNHRPPHHSPLTTHQILLTAPFDILNLLKTKFAFP